jgi:hypothetical protein
LPGCKRETASRARRFTGLKKLFNAKFAKGVAKFAKEMHCGFPVSFAFKKQ